MNGTTVRVRRTLTAEQPPHQCDCCSCGQDEYQHGEIGDMDRPESSKLSVGGIERLDKGKQTGSPES